MPKLRTGQTVRAGDRQANSTRRWSGARSGNGGGADETPSARTTGPAAAQQEAQRADGPTRLRAKAKGSNRCTAGPRAVRPAQRQWQEAEDTARAAREARRERQIPARERSNGPGCTYAAYGRVGRAKAGIASTVSDSPAGSDARTGAEPVSGHRAPDAGRGAAGPGTGPARARDRAGHGSRPQGGPARRPDGTAPDGAEGQHGR
jgi:hypothetical protein